MAKINLLPWREERRKKRQQAFLILIGAVVGAVLLIGLASHVQIESLIAGQTRRNTLIETEIAKLNGQIREIQELEETKTKLLARMDIIQELQKSRPEIVHLVDELVTTIPEGVFLTSVNQSGRSIVVDGRAQSNARVSSFMRNIEASNWIGNPLLLVIENKERTGSGLSHFRLRFEQRRETKDT